jgi:hypothetical protein
VTNTVVVDSRFEIEPYKVVHKYRLTLRPDPVVLPLPIGARLLHTNFISPEYWRGPVTGHWLLWFEVPIHTAKKLHDVVFQSIATGVEFPKCAKWMATGLRFDPERVEPTEVWHLYEYPSGAKVVDV